MAATAESCTGGLVAGLLTEIPGSSYMLERGFVVYSNAAKQELLGVPADMLVSHGAVSEQTAVAMAEGALRASRAEVAVSVTGIAGPDGGTAAKPIGLVHFACARRGSRRSRARSGLAPSAARRCGSPRSGSRSIFSRRQATPKPGRIDVFAGGAHRLQQNWPRPGAHACANLWDAEGGGVTHLKPDGANTCEKFILPTERVYSPPVARAMGGLFSRMKQMTDLSKTLCAVLLCCGFAGSAVAATDTTPNGSTNSQTAAPSTQPPAHVSQKLRDDLTKAGFKDITIMPSSFLVRAKDSQGNPMMMVINPDSVTEVTAQSAPAASGAMKKARISASNTTGSASNATALRRIRPPSPQRRRRSNKQGRRVASGAPACPESSFSALGSHHRVALRTFLRWKSDLSP